MTAKKPEAAETFEQGKEMFTKSITNSEKAVESLIEYNAAVFKGGEILAKKAYDNYIANVAAAFDGVKALNKTADVPEFYKVASSSMATASERLSEQMKEYAELSTKVMKETSEAGRAAYTKGFSGNL